MWLFACRLVITAATLDFSHVVVAVVLVAVTTAQVGILVLAVFNTTAAEAEKLVFSVLASIAVATAAPVPCAAQA
jgi:hypothetical protein